MSTRSNPVNPVISVDRAAAKQAVVRTGKRAAKAVSQKLADHHKSAARRASRAGRSAVGKLAARAGQARRRVEREVGRRRDAALRRALHACVELSRKQLQAFEKLAQDV